MKKTTLTLSTVVLALLLMVPAAALAHDGDQEAKDGQGPYSEGKKYEEGSGSSAMGMEQDMKPGQGRQVGMGEGSDNKGDYASGEQAEYKKHEEYKKEEGEYGKPGQPQGHMMEEGSRMR